MATSITNWVWSHSLSVNAGRIVLLAIAHESDRDGKAEMSVLELARKCRLGERTVQMAVRDLVSLGELSVWPKAGAHRRNGYQVIGSEGADPAPLTPAGYAPRHGRDGAVSAPKRPTPQNLHPAESAPIDALFPQVNPSDPAESAPLHIDPHVVTTTGRSEVEVKDVSEVPARDDVQRVCAHLADRIEANGCKRPVITAKWRQSARLMLDKDGRTETQLIAAIDWCQDHEFWRANILSMPKLREKYEQLRLQASRNGNGSSPTKNAAKTQILLRSHERAAEREAHDANGNGHAGGIRQRMLPASGA